MGARPSSLVALMFINMFDYVAPKMCPPGSLRPDMELACYSCKTFRSFDIFLDFSAFSEAVNFLTKSINILK